MTIDMRTTRKILDYAMSHGIDAAEVFLRVSSSTTVEVKEGKVDAFERANGAGVGLRVLLGGRMGFAFTTDISEGALKALAEAAVTNGRNVEPDPFQVIPSVPQASYGTVDIYDPEIVALSEREKIERVKAMEQEAFAVDSRIKRIRKAQAGFSEYETIITNTLGAAISYKGTACSASIEVVAEDKGEAQAGWDFDVSRFYRRLDIEEIGRRAARRALGLLGARGIQTVKAPVVLEQHVAAEFLSILASGLSAENVQKRRSLFMGRLGEDVLSPELTVYDDGRLDGGIGTAPADDEGVPMSRKIVIEKGRLLMFLHNSYTAKKDGAESTGNCVRGGFNGLPGVGVTNLYIEAGGKTLDELLAAAGEGLFVTEVMGSHTANPISGDFSVGATGFWIEKGKVSYPVREVTIAGNLLELMKNVAAVGSDLRFSGRIGSPSLLVKELSIAGR